MRAPMKKFLSTKNRRIFIASLIAALALSTQASGQSPAAPAPAPKGLLSDLKGKTAETRRAAANQLGGLRARDAVRPLFAALADKDGGVREAAAFALGQIADPMASEPLTRALKDANPEVRASAAFALGMIGDQKTTEALSDALSDEEAGVRSSVVAAFGVMQDAEGIEDLIEMLDDPDFDVRYDAVWSLGQIGEADASDQLRVALVKLDTIKADASLQEIFRQAVQNSLENIRALSGESPAPDSQGRPRRVSEPPPAPAEDKQNRSASSDSRPVSIKQIVQPLPTERALRAKINGTVGLRVLVSTGGRPVRAYVTRRLGYGLDQRAVEAAMQYRFDPATRKGVSQVEWISLDVKF